MLVVVGGQDSSTSFLSRSCLERPNSCTLPGLDLGDGAFYGAGVVLLGQPGGQGLDVAAQPHSERAQVWWVVVDGRNPRGQLY